jgi:hypothetical protein
MSLDRSHARFPFVGGSFTLLEVSLPMEGVERMGHFFGSDGVEVTSVCCELVRSLP